MRVVLATHNLGKVRELQALLAPLHIEVEPLSRFTTTAPDETGATFVENALIKARYAARVASLPAIADDSGIEVDGLNGAPGIYSARFAGPGASDEQNLRKLLHELRGASGPQRRARYRCALVYVRDPADERPIVCEADWEGEIVPMPRGTGGFGYDPIFQLLDRQLTAAELAPEEKNQISHRGKALRQLVERLQPTPS